MLVSHFDIPYYSVMNNDNISDTLNRMLRNNASFITATNIFLKHLNLSKCLLFLVHCAYLVKEAF